MVATGLQRHNKGPPPGPLAGLVQGPHLRMGPSGAGMEAFPHKLPPAVDHDGAHHGIGAGAAPRKGGERQGSVHPGVPQIGVIQSLGKAEEPCINKL